MNEFVDMFAEHFVSVRVTQHFQKRPIDEAAVALGVRSVGSFRHRIKQQIQILARILEFRQGRLDPAPGGDGVFHQVQRRQPGLALGFEGGGLFAGAPRFALGEIGFSQLPFPDVMNNGIQQLPVIDANRPAEDFNITDRTVRRAMAELKALALPRCRLAHFRANR